MKKISRLIAASAALGLGISLALSSIAFAADLTYSNDVTVTLTDPAISMTIEATSAATSVTVNTGTLVATIPSGSSFRVNSTARALLPTGATVSGDISTSCLSGNKSLVVVTASVTETITFAPDSAACTTSTGGGSPSSGGGAPAVTTPTVTTPTSTTGSVIATPAAGGTTSFTPSDSATPSVNVALPVNAVSASTTVSVTTTTLSSASITVAPSTAGITSVVGSPYSFTALSGTTSVTSFSQNVTLTFTYTDAQLPAGVSESNLGVFYFNTSTQTWESVPATINTVTNTIIAITNHFTVFIVGVKPGTTTPTTVTTGSAHANGTLVLDGSTVYLIKDGKRVGFRDPSEYKSHGYNFGQLVSANAQDKALPQAEFVQKALEGTLVLDSSDNRTVYMIGTGSTKRGFVSSAVFKALGYTFTGLVKINLSDYPSGDPIGDASLAHPDGSLVKDGATIWWIRSGQKVGFETMAVFNTYGFKVAKVLNGNAVDFALPEGTIIKLRDGTLVLDGSTYYLVSDGKKFAFTSMAQLTGLGYKTANGVKTSLAAYASGGAVQ